MIASRIANPHADRIAHHFTVDVEEYFQVAAMEPYVAREQWPSIPSRVELGTRLLLELLAERGASGTFFTLGWVAKHQPWLVREIADAGHEIASHGWGHERVTQLSPAEFRESVRRSKQDLESVIGRAVHGYRAPSFSIVRGGEWALDILLEEGYRYDSSLYPAARNGYGYEGGETDPYRVTRQAGVLDEFPPTTLQAAGRTVPAGGGAYFRLLPYALTRAAFHASERRGVPGMFYIHPWELDPDQPRIRVPFLTRIRHYGGQRGTTNRLRRLLREFSFQSVAQTLGLDHADRATPLPAGPRV